MDVEVIAPPAAESEVCAQANGLCEPSSLADQGTQELSSGEEPAAPPSPPKPKAKPRARARAKRAPEPIVDMPEPIVDMPEPIVDVPEPIVEMPPPKAKARVRKAAPKKTRPPSVEPPARWASPPHVGHSSFDLMPRIDAALHDYIRQQEWADKQRREEVVRSFRLF